VTPRLLVIVPALNEEESIASVVRDARDVLQADVVVVDDGSRDRTGDVAHGAGATVLRHPYNLGVGGAIRTALRFAQTNGYERVVQLDGDGQHLTREAVRLVELLDAGDADLVIGSRFAAGYEVTRGRRGMMRVLARVVSRRLRSSVTDTTSGFRAMGPRAVGLFATNYPLDYLSDTVEALLIAGDAGLRVRELDVQMRPRQGGQASTGSLRSVYHLLRLFLVVLLHGLRRRSPVPETT
jgi:glycosyltransferase involved in cell wall biosynthesis